MTKPWILTIPKRKVVRATALWPPPQRCSRRIPWLRLRCRGEACEPKLPDSIPPEFVKKKHQWPFQEPKLEVPTIYKAYVRPM